MNLIDFVKNPQWDLWRNFINDISTTNDHLKDNYLNIDFNEFLSFPCVLDSEKIICFSGLQYNEKKWGPGIARCSSRMWIHPEYRIQGISKFEGGSKFLNTTYCLPLQFECAKKLGIDTLFISRESNPLAFKKYLGLVKINCGMDFVLQERKYNVCGHGHDLQATCQQYVAVHCLDADAKSTWIKNMTLPHMIL